MSTETTTTGGSGTLSTAVGRAARALLAGGRSSFVAGSVLALALIVFIPTVMPDNFWLYMFLLGAVQLIAVVGLNIVVGHAGLISLGTAAFMMIGAYTVAMTNVYWGWSFVLGAVAAVVLCVAVGVVTGLPALKLGPFAVAAVSLAYLSVASSLLLLWSDKTGGGDGLAVDSDLETQNLWYVVAVIAALVFLLGRNLIRSPLGRAMRLAKLSRPLAESLGVAPSRVKLMAFATAAGLAGLSGAFYPMIDWRVTPESFRISLSVLVLLMVIFGGEGAVIGPLLGALAMVLIPLYLDEIFAEGGQWSMLTYGVILVATVVVIPRGLAGLARSVLGALARLSPPVARASVEAPVLPPVPEPAGLEVRGVAKNIGGVQALREVDLAVTGGSVHGLIGPNGSGKTTLLNCISGLLRPDRGDISIAGVALAGAASRRVSYGLARTFQAPLLVAGETVLDNVTYGTDVHRTAWHTSYLGRWGSARREAAAAHEEALGWLGVVGIAHRADEAADALPAGPRRLLEIARALATHPRIILLDEPAAGLSGPEVDELVAVIRMMRDAGITVVLVEHDTQMVMAVCDELTVLDQGVVIATGTPEEVRTDPKVIAAYLGDDAEPTRDGSLA